MTEKYTCDSYGNIREACGAIGARKLGALPVDLATKVTTLLNFHDQMEEKSKIVVDAGDPIYLTTEGGKSLRTIQKEQDAWRRHNFPKVTPEYALLGIGEELGELYHDYLKITRGIRGVTADEMKDSIGDLVIFLLSFCNVQKLDLLSIVQETWETVKQRDWVKYPKTGMPCLTDEEEFDDDELD